MHTEEQTNAEQASAEAIHKAKNAAQAIEAAREAQNAKLLEEISERTDASVMRVLTQVFSGGDAQTSPREMRVIMQRVPILCTNVEAMHVAIDALLSKVEDLQDNQKYVIRLVLGGIVTIITAVVIAFILRK